MPVRDPGEGRGTRVVTWFVAAGTLAGTSLLAFRRKPYPSPFGEQTGRGSPSTPPSPAAATMGFEPHEMRARDAALTLLGLLLSAAAAVGVIFGLLAIFRGDRLASLPHLTAEQQGVIEPPSPHLPAHPHAELYAHQAYQEGLLNSYSWLDPNHSRARIPIDRAMALTVGRSLDPAGPEPAKASDANKAGASHETE